MISIPDKAYEGKHYVPEGVDDSHAGQVSKPLHTNFT